MGTQPADDQRPTTADSIERVATLVRQFTRAHWVDMVGNDQSDRWRGGKGVLVERYFELLPELRLHREDYLVLVCGEARSRCEAGERVSQAEYAQRFPELADALAIQFELDATFGNLTGDVPRQQPSPHNVQLPGFEILREIGRGATGRVYLARQRSVDRLVAIKVVPAWNADEAQWKRHRQEASILSRMHHPNIVQIYDTIEADGALHLIIEHVDGPTLADFTVGQPLAPYSAAALVHLLAQAVHAVHEAGILHRDLKPSNVILTSRGEPKITDFGLAKLLSDGSLLTTHQCLLGTPSYMPPEQAAGDGSAATTEGDVYSLGAILYELLTGHPPFLGVTVLDTLSMIRERDPASPRTSQPQTPRDLETICLKCLAKAPQARYHTAAELADDLARFLAGAPILARRPSWQERALRSCRRNPAIAALTACLLTSALIGFLGVVWQWRQAEHARRSESIARFDADQRARSAVESLRQLRLANGFLERGYRELLSRRWNDAHTAFTRAIELRPDHVQVWEARGEFLYMRLGLWDLAAEDITRAYELQPPNLAHRWWWNALLRLHQGDQAGYREVCTRMQEIELQTVAMDYAYFFVRTLCLSPESRPQRLDLIDLAHNLALCSPNQCADAHLQALAQLRAGRAQQAIEHCRESLQAEPQGFCRELNYPILALAHHQLGQATEARAAFDQALDAMRQWTNQRLEPGPDSWVVSQGASGVWPISCWDWLECEVFVREARELLGADDAEDDPRLRVLRARAFAGLRLFETADEEYKAALKRLANDTLAVQEAHRNRAYCLVRQKEYRRAAEEFTHASTLNPNDCRLLEFQALLLLATGEVGAYRTTCAEIMSRFGNTADPTTASSAVNACTFYPGAVADMDQLVSLGQIATASSLGNVRILGAAYYRAGQYREAIDCFEQAAKMTRPKSWDMAFLAMAHYRLGDEEKARRNLDGAARWMDEANRSDPDDLTRERPAWGGWYEKIQAPILIGEAQSMMRPRNAPAARQQ